ncbi:MAG TPA: hypothetical protein ENI05_02215 [Porticoccus sp.]|nr:hypothetical protein [Porticoccus sp.]
MKKLLLIILLLLCLTANVGQSQLISAKMFGQQLNLGHWSTDGLVFFWRGIEARDAVDESFFRNHGTITGATWVGDGLDFNGAANEVALSQNAVMQQPMPMTLVSRIKPTLGNVGCVVANDGNGSGKYTGLVIFINADGKVQALIGDNGGASSVNRKSFMTTTATLTDGEEATVVAVFNSLSSIDIYINGVSQAVTSSGTGASLGYSNTGGQIGLYDWQSALPYTGVIFCASIYNRGLSASEIQALFINPNLPMQQDPIWLLFSPAVGSLQWIIDGGHIGPSPLKGSVVR